jgi:dolichol-phosphate hexosyltransferase
MVKQKNKRKPSLTILIPALNEEKNIERIVKDSLKIKEYKTEVLVVIDKKTKDKTEELAKKSGAKVIWGKGRGKGSTFRSSLPSIKTDYVVQIDADYQFIPKDIPRLVAKLDEGFDVVLGTRYQKGAKVEPGSVSALKLIGSYFLSFTTSVFVLKRITDVMAGFKAFRTDALKKINPKTPHFGYEAEMVIKASKLKFRITNVPITYRKRVGGKSSVSSIKDGLLVLDTIIKTALK